MGWWSLGGMHDGVGGDRPADLVAQALARRGRPPAEVLFAELAAMLFASAATTAAPKRPAALRVVADGVERHVHAAATAAAPPWCLALLAALDRVWRDDWGRPPDARELAAACEFVLRPALADHVADATRLDELEVEWSDARGRLDLVDGLRALAVALPRALAGGTAVPATRLVATLADGRVLATHGTAPPDNATVDDLSARLAATLRAFHPGPDTPPLARVLELGVRRLAAEPERYALERGGVLVTQVAMTVPTAAGPATVGWSLPPRLLRPAVPAPGPRPRIGGRIIAVVPSAEPDDVGALLEAALGARGDTILARVAHGAAAVHPAFARALAEHPGAGAFTLFAAALGNPCAPTTVIHQVDAAWDPSLFAALSRATGGWVLAMYLDRPALGFELVAFHAGCVVERTQPRDDAATWRQLAAWFEVVDDGAEADLRDADASGTARSLIVAGGPVRLAAVTTTPALRRGVLGGRDRAQVEAAAAALGGVPPGVVVTERHTPTAASPYVVVDGDLGYPWFLQLARALACAGAAVRLVGDAYDGTHVFWAPYDTASPRSGGGVTGLAAILGDVTRALGEPPSIVQAPPAAPGT